MSDTTANQSDGLDEIIAGYLEAEEAGEPLAAAELIAAHPEFADELREFFTDRDVLRSAARPLADAVIMRRPVLENIRYFGDFELLEEIARGGMGVVYKARQKSLNRLVAVKMILAGNLASEVDVQRFQTEAEAAARLQHPGIVSVHEVGRHDRQSYFSMDYIEGRNLSEVIRGESLLPTQAAGYVEQIAQAVHYAHQQGTLHRDLKPSNVLIDANDRVRITDFGLALDIASESQLTRTGQALGTPAYMPPEQAEGKRGLIGPASDVYAMGAILYELLTGRPPFRGETPVETMRLAIETDPLSPRLLNPSIPKDIETICLKCLEKEPARRYLTAEQLADDLQRFLNGEPISARPIGRVSRGWRWCRRKPLAASLAGALVLAVVATVVTLAVANVMINRALHDRTEALAQARFDKRAAEDALERERLAIAEQKRLIQQLADTLERTQWNAYLRGILLTAKDADTGNLAAARTRLAACGPAALRRFEWHYLASRLRSPLIVEWSNRALRSPRGVSATGVAIAEIDGELHVYDSDRTRVVHKQPMPPHEFAHTISRDGRWVAYVPKRAIRRTIRIRSLTGAPPRPVITLPAGEVVCDVIFSSDAGRVLALVERIQSASNPAGSGFARQVTQRTTVVKIWDTTTAGLIETHQLADLPTRRQVSHRNLIAADGTLRWLLTPTALFDLKSSKSVLSFHEPADVVALNRDATLAAISTKKGRVSIWNTKSGNRVDAWTTMQRVRQIAFRPHVDEVALGCVNGTVEFRDYARRVSLPPMPTKPRMRNLAFLPDGQKLMTVHSAVGGAARYLLWKRNRDACLVVSQSHIGHSLWGRQICFHPDGGRVAVVVGNGTVHVLDAYTGRVTRKFQVRMRKRDQLASVTFSPDGQTIAAAGRDGFFVWDLKTGHLHRRLQPDVGTFCTQASFSPDGDLLAGAHQDGLTVWEWKTGRVEKRLRSRGCEFRSIGFSSDGTFLFATANRGRGRILNVADWSKRCHLSHDLSNRAVLTHDNRRLAILAGSRIRFCDTVTGREVTSLKLPGRAGAFSIAPDGKRIAISLGNRVLLFDTKTGEPLLTLAGHKRRIGTLAFSPDSRRLVTASRAGTLRIWGESAAAEQRDARNR